MKLVSSLLEGIEGIQVFYTIGLLIFFVMFLIILIKTIRRPNKEMSDIKNSILADNIAEENINQN